MKKPLVILTGPTASGKTDISIKLAKRINGEIISADSIQVYKYLDIGSAKIMPNEMQGIKHYLVDEIEPTEEFNIYRFKEYAKKYIEEIYAKGKIPIIVGGTGFYIQSVIYDINFSDTQSDYTYREELYELANEKSPEFLHKMLMEIDEKSANDIHANNVKRVIRALEYYKQTGQKISDHNTIQKEKQSEYNFAYLVLNMDRTILYDRINKRVDIMVNQGLLSEVESLKAKGLTRDLVSMQGIGYKEIMQVLDNEMSFKEAIETIKKETRHFAKRQLTWFKKEREVKWINYEENNNDKEKMLEEIISFLKTKEIII